VRVSTELQLAALALAVITGLVPGIDLAELVSRKVHDELAAMAHFLESLD
jgi:hypothetical protein